MLKKSKFTDAQIGFALRQHEAGTTVREIAWKLGISVQTFYQRKNRFGGFGFSEVRRLRQLEDEKKRLKQMVA